MIPILYATISEGTVPSDYGLGSLTDALSCIVTEERNGSYELVMEYAASGIHAEDIEPNRFIMAKPNFTDSPQIFRIYKVGKEMNGKFQVFGQHISYDLSGKIVPSGTTGGSATASVLALKTQGGGNFNITTNISASRTFKVDVPSSTRSWFGGKAGSLLDIYGGEWKYDNYTCSLLSARGSDRGVQIRYGKNLTQLSQELDMSNIVTGVYGYAINPNTEAVTTGTKVLTGLTLDVPHDIAIDFSNDINWESSTAVATQLATLTTNYISGNSSSLIKIKNSITLDFVQMKDLQDRVDLCDTVHIFFEALGISASVKCVKTEWDVLAERYTKTTFGDARTNIADTISSQGKKLDIVPTSSEMVDAVNRATELITGNLGGYVVLHDSNGDGEPDEILIMNTPDIATATQIWRWNKNGLGYATAYAGPYGTAITSDGKIVADYVSTGVLNADLIKAGTISDTGGNSTINMSTGEAKLKNLTARQKLVLVDASNNERGNWQFTGTECHFAIRDTNLQNVGEMWSNTNGGQIRLSNTSQKYAVNIATSSTGGSFGAYYSDGSSKVYLSDYLEILHSNGQTKAYLGNTFNMYHTNGNSLVRIMRNGYGRGQLDLYDESGTSCATLYGDGGLGLGSGGSFSITGIGSTGVLTCISLVQTSSRKTKENIKPIEDSGKILDLQAVSFDFKNKNHGTNKRGFIAEEVAEVLPNLVQDGETPSLNYIEMIPYLQDVIKKQEERIKALEDKLNGSN